MIRLFEHGFFDKPSSKEQLGLGFGLMALGCALMAVDWVSGFKMTWPGITGSRLLIPAFILLATDGLIRLNDLQKQRKTGKI